jgi:hypothetical protein
MSGHRSRNKVTRIRADGAATSSYPPSRLAGLSAPWQPGQSGNPKGRAKGSKNKLATQFFDDLYKVWQDKGLVALERCAEEKPDVFVRVVAHLMPQHVVVDTNTEANEEQLARIVEVARAQTLDCFPILLSRQPFAIAACAGPR